MHLALLFQIRSSSHNSGTSTATGAASDYNFSSCPSDTKHKGWKKSPIRVKQKCKVVISVYLCSQGICKKPFQSGKVWDDARQLSHFENRLSYY